MRPYPEISGGGGHGGCGGAAKSCGKGGGAKGGGGSCGGCPGVGKSGMPEAGPKHLRKSLKEEVVVPTILPKLKVTGFLKKSKRYRHPA